MEDIQFWLYALFAIIYFLVRFFKKKAPEGTQGPPNSQPQNRPQRKPVSFEELLREFTEGRETEQPTAVEEEEVEYETIEEQKKEEERPFEEGKTRRFSDEESRRVYEESIARAEGSKLTFERDEHFKSKIKRWEDEEEEESVASEIKEMLSNPDDAKKAIVLSEILNRKY